MSEEIKQLLYAIYTTAAAEVARRQDEYLTTEQAAEYMKVAPREVTRFTRFGLVYYSFGKGGMRFKKKDIDTYINNKFRREEGG